MSERITGHTELIGLMAYPIRHSASPAMHNEAFAELGCDYAYLAFEVGADEIEAGVQAIRTLKMRGSNISMPNKTLVGEYLDELTPAAKMCGAVNTVVNDNGHLTGTITDGVGFMQAAADNGINPIGTKMTIVGCGGAVRQFKSKQRLMECQRSASSTARMISITAEKKRCRRSIRRPAARQLSTIWQICRS